MLMDDAEVEKDKARSPVYEAPGSRSPSRERSPVCPVLNACYTQNFRPKQVFGPWPVPKVTQATLKERRKRKEDEVAQDQKRGRQREQDPGSRVRKRQGPGPSKSQEPSPAKGQGCRNQMATGNRQARMRSQDWICNCDICKTSPGREMGVELGPEEPGRRRLKVLSTWTPPRTCSRIPCGTRQRGRSPSARRFREEATCMDELWEATTARSRSMSPQGWGRSPYRQEAPARRPQGCSLDREEPKMAWSSMDREELKKMRKQTENEKRIIEHTMEAL